MPKQPSLGNEVFDPITNIQGTLVTIIQMLNGSTQFGIQPKGKKGEIAQAFDIDSHLIEYVKEGVAKKVTPAPIVEAQLGDRVKDKVSGVAGIITKIATFMNGCIYFNVQPYGDELKNTIPEPLFYSYDRWEIVRKKAFAPTPPLSSTHQETPGGPNQKFFNLIKHSRKRD